MKIFEVHFFAILQEAFFPPYHLRIMIV